MVITVTSVTSAVASSVTSVTTTFGFSIAALSIISVIALVVFLCSKELASTSGKKSFWSVARGLDIVIVPLVIAFMMILAVETMRLLL